MKHDLLKNDPRYLTRPIGQHFFDHGVELVVVPTPIDYDNECKNCYYKDKDVPCFDCVLCRGFCAEYDRTDHSKVYFKEVKS